VRKVHRPSIWKNKPSALCLRQHRLEGIRVRARGLIGGRIERLDNISRFTAENLKTPDRTHNEIELF
jgi:hypothetical protein